LTTIKKKSSIG